MLSDLGPQRCVGVADLIVNSLDEAIVVVARQGCELVYVNEFARMQGIVRSGELQRVFRASAQQTNRSPWRKYVAVPPIEHEGRTWHVRLFRLGPDLQLLLCKPERLTERELLRRVQCVYALSERQCDLLRLLLRGLPLDEIARELDVSVRTVTRHRAHLLEAFSASTDVDIVLRCHDIRDRP